MKETELLNKALELIDKNGVSGAYNYLLLNKEKLENLSSQVYNYLYCLAALCNKNEEALSWLEEAIVKKELWYRPEIFEDEDLDNIREDFRFKSYCKLSKQRYLKALQNADTICTWKEKTNNKLILALHGNQQNIDICRESWDFLNEEKYQVEYLQSKELDSYHLYRWEDNGSGPTQLYEAIDIIDWKSYECRVICGFSSGCNVILRSIIDHNINCDKIILQSPWIPIIDEKLNEIIEILKQKDIEILIICGELDEDCIQRSRQLVKKASEEEINVEQVWVKGLSHDFPNNFREIVSTYLKKHICIDDL